MPGLEKLDDVLWRVTTMHAAMCACCKDVTGAEDPVLAHFCECTGAIRSKLQEAIDEVAGASQPKAFDEHETGDLS